ncbi:hypothetical protein ACWGK7_13585 [Sphingomonas aurantiaca]
MNEMEKQADMITKLDQLMVDQIKNLLESIVSEYQYLELYSTVSSSLSVILHETQKYSDTVAGFVTDNVELCMELRESMRFHTGGEWSSFTLSLSANGKAKTEFYYS